MLVARLRAHPAVSLVRYPGSGAMVSFELQGGAAAADAACAAPWTTRYLQLIADQPGVVSEVREP